MSTTNNQTPPEAVKDNGSNQDAMFAEQIVNPTTEQVTTFVEAGGVDDVVFNQPQRGRQMKSASELLPETLSGILERPIRLNTFKWAPELGPGSVLFDEELFSTWLSNPNFQRILNLYEYARADFSVLVQVNAQAFNAGLLLGTAYPAYPEMKATNLPCVDNIRGRSGMSSFRLDIADETSAKMEVGWFNPATHLRISPIGTAYSEYVRFQLSVYAPLTGTGDVDITVWLVARNVELAIPRGIAREPDPPTTAEPFPGEDEPAGEAQIATVETAEQQVIKFGTNAVRQTAVAAKTAATWWNTISGLAVVLGLSKPRIPEPTTRFQPNVMDDMANGDGASAPKLLGMFKDNSLDNSPIKSLDAEDPHVIANIIKKPCYHSTIRWHAQDQPERLIGRFLHTPADEPLISGRRNGTKSRSWLSWFAQIFRFWSGSITYRVYFVKTKFHSGRIEFSYIPFRQTSQEDRDHTNAFRVILDIREGSVFDITVPYMFPMEMLDRGAETGTILLKVVNDLVVGGGAAPYVDIVVERYSNDMVFAIPENVTQVSGSLPTEASGEVQLREDKIVHLDLAPTSDIAPVRRCAYTVGEVITDIRQLMKRYLPIIDRTATSTENFCYPHAGPRLANTEPITDWEIKDYLGTFAPAFGFMTGGVRILIQTQAAMEIRQFIETQPQSYFTYQGTRTRKSGDAVILKTAIEPTIEVQIPYYARVPYVASPTYCQVSNAWRGRDNPHVSFKFDVGAPHTFYRSIAEDFSFGLLLGPPCTHDVTFY